MNLLITFITSILVFSGYVYVKTEIQSAPRAEIVVIPETAPPAMAAKAVSPLQPKVQAPTPTQAPAPFDFSHSPLDSHELAPFLESKSPPTRIQLNDENGQTTFRSKTPSPPSEKILQVGTETFARQIAQDRVDDALKRESQSNGRVQDAANISPHGYRFHAFHPGLRDDAFTLIALPMRIASAIQGPDFSHESLGPTDPEQLAELKNRVVSLGHGGEIILRISGFVVDRRGPDFAIYENVFRFGAGKLYQEFAKVGVSETLRDQDFVWFACRPDLGQLKGCAGVVPTDEGGDAFDLAEVKLKKVQYIKIKDMGDNYNLGENTEGFDLDAMRIFHGTKK